MAWNWYLSSNDERLYHQQNDCWVFHPGLPGRASREGTSRFTTAVFDIAAIHLPPDLVRVTVDICQDVIVHTRGAPTTLLKQLSPLATFSNFLAAQSHDLKWALPATVQEAAGKAIATAIGLGQCIGVSDGSFKAKFGTVAWTLADSKDLTVRLSGKCVVPGQPTDQSAFRSEVSGLYALCHTIRLVCDYYRVLAGQVVLACDGKEALHRVFAADFEPMPRDEHFDLLIGAWEAIRQTPITWVSKWVKGHQDDDVTAELDDWAKLNVAMDWQAKLHWERHYPLPQLTRQYKVFGEPWPLWLGKEKLCRDLRGQIINIVNGTPACLWWEQHKKMPSGASVTIDWVAPGQALTQSVRS